MCVHIIFSSVWVAGERAAHSVDHVFSLYFDFSYFPFWFRGLDLGSDCFSPWSLHTFYSYVYRDVHLIK